MEWFATLLSDYGFISEALCKCVGDWLGHGLTDTWNTTTFYGH